MVEESVVEKREITELRLALLSRILATEHFSRAPRLERFLSYVTTCYLEQRLDEISEQQIGVHVFDKSANYNPGDDNIVRSYARILRKRLDDYFSREGIAEPVLLQIPKGGYVPRFVERHSATPEHVTPLDEPVITVLPAPKASRVPELPASVASHSLHASGSTRRPIASWVALALVLVLAWSALCYRLGRHSAEAVSTPAVHEFWRDFVGDRTTLLVPSDTGLTMLLGLTKSKVNVADYVTGAYVQQDAVHQLLPEGWANANVHRYTDLIDVKLIGALARLPELASDKTTIRYARDLRADDLKSGNALLIGGENANPWVQIFDPRLNFALEFEPEKRNFLVRNRHPRPGELALYPYGPENWSEVSYGLVALRPGINGSGYVLLVEGVAAAGLQAAGEYLLSEANVAPLMEQVRDGHGGLRPFEMLLRTSNVGANSAKTELVALRVD